MSSIYTDIRAALETRLGDTASIPDIAWENVSYSPTTGSPFIKPMFSPTSRRPAVRFTNPQKHYLGIFTLLCHYPENQGPGASQRVVDTLVERFDATTDVSYTNADSETIILSLEYAEQKNPYSNPPWFVTPIIIGWQLYL